MKWECGSVELAGGHIIGWDVSRDGDICCTCEVKRLPDGRLEVIDFTVNGAPRSPTQAEPDERD